MISLDVPLRFSKWCFVFIQEECEDIALYHSLNIDVIFIEKQFERMIDLLQKGTTVAFLIREYDNSLKQDILKSIKEMIQSGLVVDVGTDDQELLKEKRKNLLPVGIESLYLMLTDRCNLNCSYCFINNNMPTNYQYKNMDWKVAKEAIDMFFFNLIKNSVDYDNSIKTIFFYGGEPFLNFKLIKKSVEYIESYYCKEIDNMGDYFRFSTITNGTFINKDIAKFLSQHKNIAIGVSLDGEKSIHDKKRVYKNGMGSFDKAIEGCLLLKEEGCENISISCTIDDHNIEELNLLLNLHKEHGFLAINLNPLLDTAKAKISSKYMEIVSQNMLKYFELARVEGVYEDRIMRKLKAFISRQIHPFDCQATGNQVVCSPDGRLGVCHEGIGAKNFFFLDVSKDFDFHSNSIIKEWNRRTPLNMPQCFNCSAIGICGGGCTYGAWLRNGSIWSIDNRFCTHSLLTLKWLVWDVYKTF